MASVSRDYFGIPNVTYQYKNTDNEDFPAKGMFYSLNVGGIDNLKTKDITGFAKSDLVFYNSLSSTGRVVFKTAVHGDVTIGDRPAFYQSPSLGGNSGLRGYRNQRFTGDYSLVGNGDVIYNFDKIKTFFFPIDLSIYAGYDGGRVWVKHENSTAWHSSYGGGLILKWTEAIKGNISTFYSEEGTYTQFGFKLSY